MYPIVSDLGADLPLAWLEGRELVKINQAVELDGVEELIPLDEESLLAYYQRLQGPVCAKTRAMREDELLSVLEPLAKVEKELLCISFSSALSGTGAQMARTLATLSEKYGCKAVYWDSRQASCGQAVLVKRALDNRDKGMSIEENVADLEKASRRVVFEVLLGKNNRFGKGGRAGLMDEGVGLPLLRLESGKLYTRVGKVLFLPIAIESWARKLALEAEDGSVVLGHGSNKQQAEECAALLAKESGKRVDTTVVNPVMGAHTGDGVLMLAYLGKE